MKMSDVLVIIADRPYYITLHYLHVIDVIQQLDSRRIDALDDLDSKGRMVSLVALMIHFAIEQLDHHGDSIIFGGFLDPIQADHAVIDRLFVADPIPVSEKSDQVGNTVFGGQRERPFKSFDNGVMVGLVVDSFGNISANLPTKRANQAIVADYRPLGFVQKVDCSQAHFGHCSGELRQRYAPVAPIGYGLFQPATLYDSLERSGIRNTA